VDARVKPAHDESKNEAVGISPVWTAERIPVFEAELLARRVGRGGEMEARMPRTLKDVIAALSAHERRRIEARAEQLIAEEMSLQNLRKAIGKTQTVIAKRLGVGQHAVSKLEARGDMYISTLRSFLKAMGGRLELVARFPNRPPVRLEELGTAASRRKRERHEAA
jgi:DNA-binding transcriptional regulator YiaG